MGNHELRLYWRENRLESIKEFADEPTQRRTWLDTTNRNPYYSFSEYFCRYFDDLVLLDGYERRLAKGLVTVEEMEAVLDFHTIAAAYTSPADDYHHHAILADPKWADVVSEAKRAQRALLSLLDDPRERQLLMEP